VVLSTGGAKTGTQFWHADGLERTPPNTALCCFLPLIDLTEETGYTSFWPGTHNSGQSALLSSTRFPAALPPASTHAGVGRAGEPLLYDYKVIHRGEPNAMPAGAIRPIVYLVYGRADWTETNFVEGRLEDWLAAHLS